MKRIAPILFLLFLSSCFLIPEKKGRFSGNVTNFEALNTEYDDYNMTAPFESHNLFFHFSSNRNSNGNNFDIVGENIIIDWDISENKAIIKPEPDVLIDEFLNKIFDTINTPNDELGPNTYFISPDSIGSDYSNFLTLYANNEKGRFNMKYIYGYRHNRNEPSEIIQQKGEIEFLNSDANEFYPSFYGHHFFNHNQWSNSFNDIEKMFYCSDKDGSFNIYEVSFSNTPFSLDLLKKGENLKSIKSNISSNSNDKCPFVNGKLMVFTSDRDGGYGGYDLYYSVYKNDKWCEPVNFGPEINTEYDEYRPITLYLSQFKNSLMFFSSNRPGGLGGYDLYYVGIEQMIR